MSENRLIKFILGLIPLFWVINIASLGAQNFSSNLLGYKLIREYNIQQLNGIFNCQNLDILAVPLRELAKSMPPAENKVKTYLVYYLTTNYDGMPVKASGLLAIPSPVKTSCPVLSYQHDTILDSKKCPSYPADCLEAQGIISIFAAHGYVVLAPDYIGQGHCRQFHPYLVAENEAVASVDMLQASRVLCRKLGVNLNEKLFITGYAQGGQATLALQKLLETDFPDLKITASAPLEGPYDLTRLWQDWIKTPDPLTGILAARMITAYKRVYRFPDTQEQIFRPEYLSKLKLLEGKFSENAVIKAFPGDLHDLLTTDFLNRVNSGRHPFYEAMVKNQTADFAPSSPTALIHSPGDTLFPYDLARSAYDKMIKLGADDLNLIQLGKSLEHRQACLVAIYRARLYFDGFSRVSFYEK